MNPAKIITKLKTRKPTILGEENFRKYAVLLPLLEINRETHILFEVRSMNLRSQPGDICFPGGRVDKEDKNEEYSAIRETSEELGIAEADVYDVVPLDYMVSDFGRIIYPHIGRIKDINKVTPNKAEVAETFTVPLNYFLETKPDKYKINFDVNPAANFPYELINGGENYDWQIRQAEETFYNYDGKVIWGITAKILTHFIALLQKDSFS